MTKRLAIAFGSELLLYSFPPPHPLNSRRVEAFFAALREEVRRGLSGKVELVKPSKAEAREVMLFHTEEYVRFVEKSSETGRGYLDYGDTPAYKGCYEAALYVVGTTLSLLRSVLEDRYARAFNPMGGLHHAMRDRAGGFCIFNDAGVAIEYVLRRNTDAKVAYVDIDAHHGDGVYYEFESDPRVIFVDIHQDGRTLYPGTGYEWERGRGPAVGTKLNIPLPPRAGDEGFVRALDRAIEFLRDKEFDVMLLQVGADGLVGDPLTSLNYTPLAHRVAVTRLIELAEEKCEGRVLAMGGGGYNVENVVKAWMEVVRAMASD